ncbi:MAG: hypothetical protein ACP5TO_07585 [Thermoplasmata archaeon]
MKDSSLYLILFLVTIIIIALIFGILIALMFTLFALAFIFLLDYFNALNIDVKGNKHLKK